MPLVLDATVGGASSNSYLTVAEADAYFESRIALVPAWEDTESKDVNLVMATRVLDSLFRGKRRYIPAKDGMDGYYLIDRAWTGSAASTTQRLAWPRANMYDQNGNVIATTVIPQELKDAVAELAGQLNKSDSTLNNDVVVQGLTSIRAGSVALSFKDTNILPMVIPDAVINLLIPSWYTEEIIEGVVQPIFDVVS